MCVELRIGAGGDDVTGRLRSEFGYRGCGRCGGHQGGIRQAVLAQFVDRLSLRASHFGTAGHTVGIGVPLRSELRDQEGSQGQKKGAEPGYST